MAVMRTCCGCLTTRSGSLTILFLYLIGYIAGIVLMSMEINNPGNWIKPDKLDCLNTTSKDTWWCKAGSNFKVGMAFIFFIVILIIFAIFDLLAIYGTVESSRWFIMPWIVAEFIRLFVKLLLLILTIVLWVIFMDASSDTTYIVAIGVIGIIFMTFFFYLWLCIVSHYQVLRDYARLQQDSMKNVVPFNDDDGYYPERRNSVTEEDLSSGGNGKLSRYE